MGGTGLTEGDRREVRKVAGLNGHEVPYVPRQSQYASFGKKTKMLGRKDEPKTLLSKVSERCQLSCLGRRPTAA